MASEVLTAVKMSMLVFWTVIPRALVGRYYLSGEKYYLQTLKMELVCSSRKLVSAYKYTLHLDTENKLHGWYGYRCSTVPPLPHLLYSPLACVSQQKALIASEDYHYKHSCKQNG
jgi:hypothetical protein